MDLGEKLDTARKELALAYQNKQLEELLVTQAEEAVRQAVLRARNRGADRFEGLVKSFPNRPVMITVIKKCEPSIRQLDDEMREQRGDDRNFWNVLKAYMEEAPPG